MFYSNDFNGYSRNVIQQTHEMTVTMRKMLALLEERGSIDINIMNTHESNTSYKERIFCSKANRSSFRAHWSFAGVVQSYGVV